MFKLVLLLALSGQGFVRLPAGTDGDSIRAGRVPGVVLDARVPFDAIVFDSLYRKGLYQDTGFVTPWEVLGLPDLGGDPIRGVEDSGSKRCDFITYAAPTGIAVGEEFSLRFDGHYLHARRSEARIDLAGDEATLCVFFKADDIQGNRTAASKNFGSQAFSLRVQNGVLRGWYNGNGNNGVPIEAGVWMAVCNRYRQGELSLFVDGVLAAQQFGVEPLVKDGNPFLLGAHNDGPGGRTDYWYGWIGQALLLDRAMSDEEILALSHYYHDHP